jgi:hypothetical protein
MSGTAMMAVMHRIALRDRAHRQVIVADLAE